MGINEITWYEEPVKLPLTEEQWDSLNPIEYQYLRGIAEDLSPEDN